MRSHSKQIMVLGQPAQSALGTARGSARSSGASDLARARRQRADVLGSGGAPPLARRAMRRFRQARGERAEAGSDNFVSSFMRCESHVARSRRVNVTLHENLLCTPPACRTARTSHNSLARDTGVPLPWLVLITLLCDLGALLRLTGCESCWTPHPFPLPSPLSPQPQPVEPSSDQLAMELAAKMQHQE